MNQKISQQRHPSYGYTTNKLITEKNIQIETLKVEITTKTTEIIYHFNIMRVELVLLNVYSHLPKEQI